MTVGNAADIPGCPTCSTDWPVPNPHGPAPAELTVTSPFGRRDRKKAVSRVVSPVLAQRYSGAPGPLAHPEEQRTFNPKVPGSRPGRPTDSTNQPCRTTGVFGINLIGVGENDPCPIMGLFDGGRAARALLLLPQAARPPSSVLPNQARRYQPVTTCPHSGTTTKCLASSSAAPCGGCFSETGPALGAGGRRNGRQGE